MYAQDCIDSKLHHSAGIDLIRPILKRASRIIDRFEQIEGLGKLLGLGLRQDSSYRSTGGNEAKEPSDVNKLVAGYLNFIYIFFEGEETHSDARLMNESKKETNQFTYAYHYLITFFPCSQAFQSLKL
jgi:hypothetical protein